MRPCGTRCSSSRIKQKGVVRRKALRFSALQFVFDCAVGYSLKSHARSLSVQTIRWVMGEAVMDRPHGEGKTPQRASSPDRRSGFHLPAYESKRFAPGTNILGFPPDSQETLQNLIRFSPLFPACPFFTPTKMDPHRTIWLNSHEEKNIEIKTKRYQHWFQKKSTSN